MARERVYIGNQLNLSSAGRSPADTAREWDGQAAMPAFIGPDLEQLRPGHAVEPGPVEAVIGVMYLAGDSGHQADCIGFAFGQRGNGFGKRCVVGHVIFVGVSPPIPEVLVAQRNLDAFNRDGSAFATADADRSHTALQPTLFQRVEKCHHDPCARSADGMA